MTFYVLLSLVQCKMLRHAKVTWTAIDGAAAKDRWHSRYLWDVPYCSPLTCLCKSHCLINRCRHTKTCATSIDSWRECRILRSHRLTCPDNSCFHHLLRASWYMTKVFVLCEKYGWIVWWQSYPTFPQIMVQRCSSYGFSSHHVHSTLYTLSTCTHAPPHA